MPIFEAAAANVDGEPCVRYMGPNSAGHYVKMVHNGIEYGDMQLIAETYDLMKRGLSLTDDELHSVYEQWNQGEINSFLIEITSQIFLKVDEQTGKRLIDEILDEAKQKGTGKWASQDAMELRVPIPTIDAAVSARDLSAYKAEREKANQRLTGPAVALEEDRDSFLKQLRSAFYGAMIITYTQGMTLLTRASRDHHYNLVLEDIATIWRGGCIIRAVLLERIRSQVGVPVSERLVDVVILRRGGPRRCELAIHARYQVVAVNRGRTAHQQECSRKGCRHHTMDRRHRFLLASLKTAASR
jgi:6-phosphogluconate dehydrogenase